MPTDPLPPDDDPLYDLLAEWEERRRSGPEPSAEVLCPEAPELRERLRREIALLKGLDACLGLDRPPLPAAPLTPPDIPGIIIDEEIGRGAMGVVYRGRQGSLNRSVAVKVILGGVHAAGHERARFRTEGVATARIPHPNIVTIHGSGESGGLPYLLLEYLDGGSLADRLQGEPQAPAWSAELVRTLAGAVAAAHERGVIHRDLKPRNILFGADGTPKIADYGLAKLLDDDPGHTVAGQSPGTPSYMAPEQAGPGRHPIGPPTDVYALGAILYELITGRPPFRGATVLDTLELVRSQDPVPPGRLQPKTPRDLETICLKCLEKDPDRRYQTAAHLVDDLQRFLEGRPISARPIGPFARAWRWSRRRPALAASFVSLVLVTAGGLAGMTWLWSVASAERDRAESRLDQVLAAEANLTRLADSIGSWSANLVGRPDEVDSPRKQILETFLVELERLNEKLSTNPRLERERILIAIRISQIHNVLGNKQKALARIHAAVEQAERFLEKKPASSERKELLAGAIHRELVEEPYSTRLMSLYHRAETLYAELLSSESGEKRDGYQGLRMLNAFNVGVRMLEAGRDEESLRFARRACELGEPLAGRKHPDALTVRGLGAAYTYVAELEEARGRRADAKTALLRSRELFKKNHVARPGGLEPLFDYCAFCEQQRDYHLKWGEAEEAATCTREMCRVLEEASGQSRTESDALKLRRRLAQSYYMLMIQYVGIDKAAAGGDSERVARILPALEEACRNTRRLADSLGEILTNDADLEYWNATSCFHLHDIARRKDAKSEEAGLLIARACALLESSLKKAPNEGRRVELEEFRKALVRFPPKAVDPEPTRRSPS